MQNKFSPRHATEYDTPNCEITWSELQTPNGTVYTGSYYRPPKSPDLSLTQLDASINQIRNDHKNATIILGGDFNLPGINWETCSVKPKADESKQCQLLLDIMANHGLVQMNLEPTRKQNTLDLCFTSSPGLVSKTQTAPGFSDHDHMVVMETKICAVINKKKPRTIVQYDKADTDKIKQELIERQELFYQSLPNENSVEENWAFFKETVKDIEERFIPKKKIR